jgi:hypothetical protein
MFPKAKGFHIESDQRRDRNLLWRRYLLSYYVWNFNLFFFTDPGSSATWKIFEFRSGWCAGQNHNMLVGGGLFSYPQLVVCPHILISLGPFNSVHTYKHVNYPVYPCHLFLNNVSYRYVHGFLHD